LGTVPIFPTGKWDCPLPKSGTNSSDAPMGSGFRIQQKKAPRTVWASGLLSSVDCALSLQTTSDPATTGAKIKPEIVGQDHTHTMSHRRRARGNLSLSMHCYPYPGKRQAVNRHSSKVRLAPAGGQRPESAMPPTFYVPQLNLIPTTDCR
jgi:hypothetical protein